MPPEPSAPKEYLTLYRDGSLGRALIEAIDELIIAGHFPIIPGAAPDHPVDLTSEPAGSEAADPIDLTNSTTTSSSPTTSTTTNTNTTTSSSPSSPTTPQHPISQPQQQQSLAPLTHKVTNHLLITFDRVIAQTLATHDEVVKKSPAIKMKGRLKQYRLVDDIWRFWVEDVEVVVGSERRRRGRTTGSGRGGRAGRGGTNGGVGGDGGGGKRERDGDGDGDGEERAGKRRRGDGGEARAVDDPEDQGKQSVGNGYGGGPGVIKVDKLLIVACDGRGSGQGDDGKRKKRRG